MGLFWLGAGGAYFAKLAANRGMKQHAFYRTFYSGPWQFPLFMVMGGVAAMYYDWYRRLALEAVCQAEQLNESTRDAQHRMMENPLLK